MFAPNILLASALESFSLPSVSTPCRVNPSTTFHTCSYRLLGDMFGQQQQRAMAGGLFQDLNKYLKTPLEHVSSWPVQHILQYLLLIVSSHAIFSMLSSSKPSIGEKWFYFSGLYSLAPPRVGRWQLLQVGPLVPFSASNAFDGMCPMIAPPGGTSSQ